MQPDFDDLIFWRQTFFLIFNSKKMSDFLHKNDRERKLFYMVNEKDTREALPVSTKYLKVEYRCRWLPKQHENNVVQNTFKICDLQV